MRFFGKRGNFLGRSNSRASLLWEYALGHRSGNVVCGIMVIGSRVSARVKVVLLFSFFYTISCLVLPWAGIDSFIENNSDPTEFPR